MKDFGRSIIGFQNLNSDLLPSARKEGPLYEHSADDVRQIIDSGDKARMREVSHYFYTVSGIYKRLIYLFASMPNFDNLIMPHFLSDKIPEEKFMKDFQSSMTFIDSLDLKTILPLICLAIFKNGIYFGYLRDDKPEVVIQTLPTVYCRSNYKKDNRYTVEFNLQYFDREFSTNEDRQTALKQFPKEFIKEYNKYKTGKTKGMQREWVLLDVDRAICFKLPDEMPFFFPIIIDLIELRQAKDVELAKDKMELFQLLVQKLPIDKIGDLVFDLDESRELHKNAIKMLQNNEGIDVLTTPAEIDMLNIKEARQVMKDNLLKTERSVFNESGVSKMIMATEGNVTLKFSLLKDEAIFKFLWPQFNAVFTHFLNLQSKKTAKYFFELWIPPTTIFNVNEMQDTYTKLATFGYAKLLPGIITGMSQNSLLNLMKFENDYLKLNEMMEPLKSTHTMSPSKEGDPGRPPKPEEDKVGETIENEETGNQGGEE